MNFTRAQAKTEAELHQHASRGTLMALLGGVCGGTVGVAVATAKDVLPSSELVIFRFLLAAIFLFLMCRRSLHRLRDRAAIIVWLGAVAGAVSAVCYYATFQVMAVGTAMTINHLSLVLIVLFSFLFLGESLSRKQLCGVATMLFAVFVLKTGELSAPPLIAFLIGVAGAVSLAICNVSVRHAVTLGFPPTLIVFAFSLMSFAIVPLLPSSPWVWPTNVPAISAIAVTCVAGISANLLVTSASRHLHAGIVSTLTKLSLVWAVLLGILVNGAWPRPAEWMAYGLAIVAVMMLQNIRWPGRIWVMTLTLDGMNLSKEEQQVIASELKQAVSAAEVITSCEFKLHVDFVTVERCKENALTVFRNSDVQQTELGNGVLLAIFAKPSTLAIVFDKGIAFRCSRRELHQWCQEAFANEAPSGDFADRILHGLPALAEKLSDNFPVAIDDVNEREDEVSFVIE